MSNMNASITIFILYTLILSLRAVSAFLPVTSIQKTPAPTSSTILKLEQSSYERKNAAVSVLSNFVQDDVADNSLIDTIDFGAPKCPMLPLETLAQVLDYELYNREWFVTGNVNPSYFSEKFEFQDPDVKLVGIENYARGVNKLFDQSTSRAEIISVQVSDEKENTITVRWRLSGKVNIGPFGGLSIKPYICITDFTVDPSNGLIVFQEDSFDIPQWDILLSALFPFLIGKITKDPAPAVTREKIPVMPNIGRVGNDIKGINIFDGFIDKIKKLTS